MLGEWSPLLVLKDFALRGTCRKVCVVQAVAEKWLEAACVPVSEDVDGARVALKLGSEWRADRRSLCDWKPKYLFCSVPNENKLSTVVQ